MRIIFTFLFFFLALYEIVSYIISVESETLTKTRKTKMYANKKRIYISADKKTLKTRDTETTDTTKR